MLKQFIASVKKDLHKRLWVSWVFHGILDKELYWLLIFSEKLLEIKAFQKGPAGLTLRAQIAAVFLCLVFFTVLAAAFSIQEQLRASLTQEVQLRGLTVARQLAGLSGDFLLNSEKLNLANICQGARENEDVLYVRVVDAHGILRASSPSTALEVPFYPPNDLQPLGTRDSSVQRFYDGHQWIEDVMVPIHVGDQRVGLVDLGLDERTVDSAVSAAELSLLWVGLGVLASCLLLAVALSIALARPVERLTRAVHDLGSGLLETRVQSSGALELRQLEDSFNQMAARLQNQLKGATLALARALGEHDQVSPGHAERVSRLAVRTAAAMGLQPREIEELRLAGQLIDIGHMGVPTQLLHKVDPLTDEELRRLRVHPQVGVRIIEPLTALKPVMPLLMHHHERFDGRGYPLGLRGDAIPLGARILAVADSYDAMLTEKRHRRARSQTEASRELQRCAGQQFDPKVVEAFVRQLTTP
jgi:HAMP domain-containing protein